MWAELDGATALHISPWAARFPRVPGIFLPSRPGRLCVSTSQRRSDPMVYSFPWLWVWMGEVFTLCLMNDAQCESGDITCVSVAVELFIGEKITRDQPRESAIIN